MLEDGYDIPKIQELLDHKDVSTTIVYTHAFNRGGLGMRSLLDGALREQPGRRRARRPRTRQACQAPGLALRAEKAGQDRHMVTPMGT